MIVLLRGTRGLVKREFTETAPTAVGDRSEFRSDLGGRRVRLLHHRRVQPDNRGVAVRVAHAHRDRPRRDRHGVVCARHPPRRSAVLRRPGSQFTSIRYGERWAEIGAAPSIGTVGGGYYNALAETVDGYYKTELVRGPARSGLWKTVEDLELATPDGCTGTTLGASTDTSATCRQRSSSRPSMLSRPQASTSGTQTAPDSTGPRALQRGPWRTAEQVELATLERVVVEQPTAPRRARNASERRIALTLNHPEHLRAHGPVELTHVRKEHSGKRYR